MYCNSCMKSRMSRLHIETDELVKELNGESTLGPKNRPSASVVNRLRQLCANLEELEQIRRAIAQREPQAIDPVSTAERLWAWPNLQLKHPASQELNASGERILKRVNAQLKQLRTREGVMLTADARGLQLRRWQPIDFKKLFTTGWMYIVLELLQSGNLYRLRRCQRVECRRWFFAQTDWQKYCSRNCRQLEAAQGQTFKERRRAYMRVYRSNEKARDLNARKLVRGK